MSKSEHLAPIIDEPTRVYGEEIRDLISQVGDQNDRYRVSKDIGNEALRRVVEQGIGDEQIDSILALQGAYTVSHEQVDVELSEAAAQLEEARRHWNVDEELMDDLELAKLLTGRRHDELERAHEAEQDKYRSSRLNDLEQSYEETVAHWKTINDAWPIPLAIPPERRNALYETQPSIDVVDVIPVTPEKRERSALIAEEIRKYKVENPSLSADILEHLTNRIGEIVTVDDLIEYCYGPVDALRDQEERIRYRSKITCALGPEVCGRKLSTILNQAGFTLQYGERRVFEMVNGHRKQQTRFHRIYRVILIEDMVVDDNQDATDKLGIVDTWSVGAVPHGGSIEELESLDEILTEDGASDEQLLDDNESIEEFEQAVVSVEEQKNSANEQESSWQETLATDAESAIRQMIDSSLFYDSANEFGVAAVIHRAASSMIGTKTSCQRLAAAGLIGRFKDSAYKEIVLTRNQIVYSYLINSHPELRNKNNKKVQREAIAIVDAMIERYLAELDSQG